MNPKQQAEQRITELRSDLIKLKASQPDNPSVTLIQQQITFHEQILQQLTSSSQKS